MSVRMNATLFSEVARIERGIYLTFECAVLSHDGRDLSRQFIGAFYPRWRALYLEEVRSVIGNMGRTELRHFPAYPFDVYLKDRSHDATAMHVTSSGYGDNKTLERVDESLLYRSEDFYVGNVLILGTPRNQRDDDVKRFRIVSVDVSKLYRRGVPLDVLRRASQLTERTMTKRVADGACVSSSFAAHPHSHTAQQLSYGGGSLSGTTLVAPPPASPCKEVMEIIHALRDAYIDYVGGGVPEVGIKAMGRPFRRAARDGRRWITWTGMCALVAQSRALDRVDVSMSENRILTAVKTGKSEEGIAQPVRAEVERVAGILYDAFPHASLAPVLGVCGRAAVHACDATVEDGVDYDVFMDCVRGHMNRTRKTAVQRVFDHMDFDKDGFIAIHDIQVFFNAKEHPVVAADGICAADQLMRGFLLMWDCEETRHGHVPYTEFVDYYNGLSYAIERDDVFLAVLRSTWKLPCWNS